MSFLHLNSDENSILTLRRHWSVIAEHAIGSVVLGLLVLPAWLLLRHVFPTLFVAPYDTMVLVGVTLYLLFVWVGFFLNWVDYYLDVWIVTTKRVIDVEQKGLFQREASEFPLERIQDITVEINGPVQTFLDFGDVHVQTAGEGREFVFEQVPDPEHAKRVLLREHRRRARETQQQV